MKIGKWLLVAMACVVLAAGCERGAEHQATPAVESTPPASAAADAPVQIETPPFDMKAFAGTFSADGNAITLNPDGSYTSKLGDAESDGTWNADPAGTELLLDPTSKAEADGRYAVLSDNAIRAVDGGMTLQRDGAAE